MNRIVAANERVKCACTVYSLLYYRVVQKKIAQSLMHRHFETVCSRITRFSPKCSEKITIYQSMLNLYQLVKYSSISNRNWIHVNDVTLHVNMTPLTVEDQLSINTSQTDY